ncbi:MAG: hypothetical protein WKF87_16665 [Chryseolinea sp.]
MRQVLLFFSLLSTLVSCGQPKQKKVDYPSQVGDIASDLTVDDPDFTLCDERQVYQYYNFGKGLQYNGEKIKINQHFKDGYKIQHQKMESGFLTIRFVVNCQGKTGRYRAYGMDNDYHEKTFDQDLTVQLLTLTKKLDGWIPGALEGKTYDYYQYLTFKIENGELREIMP